MSLSVAASVTAMAPGLTTSVVGIGGVAPYSYALAPNGAGGSIDAVTGIYSAPIVLDPDPRKSSDTIVVTDNVGATASAKILVTSPLGLFCDILQKELELADGRVYFWDQKINEPIDSGLYVAVGILNAQPFANTISTDGSGAGLDSVQSVSMLLTMSVDIISRGPEARDRKEEVVLALNSIYAQSQQELNSFYLGKLPPGNQFVNLSNLDGAAIPYRFSISVNMQYIFQKKKAVRYFDSFDATEVTTES